MQRCADCNEPFNGAAGTELCDTCSDDFVSTLDEDYVRLSKELKEACAEIKQLKEWIKAKQHIDDVSNQWYKDEVKPIRHLWPLENNPGIGQVVTVFQAMLTELEICSNNGWYSASELLEKIKKGEIES